MSLILSSLKPTLGPGRPAGPRPQPLLSLSSATGPKTWHLAGAFHAPPCPCIHCPYQLPDRGVVGSQILGDLPGLGFFFFYKIALKIAQNFWAIF